MSGSSLASGAEALSTSKQGPLELSGCVPSVGALGGPLGQSHPAPSAANSTGGSVSQSPEFAVV